MTKKGIREIGVYLATKRKRKEGMVEKKITDQLCVAGGLSSCTTKKRRSDRRAT